MPPRPPIHHLLRRCREFSTLPRLRAEAESAESTELKVSLKWDDRKDVKEMRQWIDTEGQAYRRPAPDGGPNYLKRRGGAGRRKDDSEEMDDDESHALELESQRDAVDAALEVEMKVLDGEDFMRKLGTNQGLAQKWPQKPFELNPYFVSLPVLSEMLKEAIYKYVLVDGHDVRNASEHFRVSVERIAAVVRMKQIERNLVKAVSLSSFSFPLHYYDELFKLFDKS
jgi:Eukaryotic mitochondrial regulator protein